MDFFINKLRISLTPSLERFEQKIRDQYQAKESMIFPVFITLLPYFLFNLKSFCPIVVEFLLDETLPGFEDALQFQGQSFGDEGQGKT